MRARNEYVLNYGTSLFLPYYGEQGNLSTIIFESGSLLKHELNPTRLIDFNLRYFGSSFRGANDGSRMILGEMNMSPLVISEKLDLYWFPSKSPSKEDCVWFALHHVIDSIGIDKKKTKVILSDGNTVIVDVSRVSFEKKVQRAYTLKYKMESRTSKSRYTVSESSTVYHISKESNERNFALKKK